MFAYSLTNVLSVSELSLHAPPQEKKWILLFLLIEHSPIHSVKGRTHSKCFISAIIYRNVILLSNMTHKKLMTKTINNNNALASRSPHGCRRKETSFRFTSERNFSLRSWELSPNTKKKRSFVHQQCEIFHSCTQLKRFLSSESNDSESTKMKIHFFTAVLSSRLFL